MPRLDVYGEKWERLRDRAAALVDSGEDDLSRVLRLVEDWRSADASPMEAPVFDYNSNLWPLLRELEAEGELRIETVVPDLIGIKPHNASTLVVWHR